MSGKTNSAAATERLSSVRSRIHDDNRISLTEFARGKDWRTKLATNGFMELQEHGERIAWIISEEGMSEVVDYIEELEGRVERASIYAMLRAREGRNDWKSGPELADAAKAYLLENYDELMGAVDGD